MTMRDGLLRLLALTIPLMLFTAASHAQDDESVSTPTPAAIPDDPTPGPEGMEYPGILRLFLPTSFYVDHTYQRSSDLNTMAWVRGSGQNFRLALGTILKFGAWNLWGELPLQYTQLTIDKLQEQDPNPADHIKGALSLGDLQLGATYGFKTTLGPVDLSLGLGLRTRIPSHTMRFSFRLINGGSISFGIPYYLHTSSTIIAAATYGPLAFTTNQGVLGMFSKDTDIGGIPQPIPSIYFWEAHYALSCTGLGPFTAWVELVHLRQLNTLNVVNFERVNGLNPVSLQPGLAMTWDRYVFIAQARIGLNQDTQDMGVLAFSGDQAFLTRVSVRY